MCHIVFSKRIITFFFFFLATGMTQLSYADKLVTAGHSLVYVSNCYFYYFDVPQNYWRTARIFNSDNQTMSTSCEPSGWTGLSIGNIVDVVSDEKGKLIAIEEGGISSYAAVNNAWYSEDTGQHWYTHYPNTGDAGGCLTCFPFRPVQIHQVNGKFIALSNGLPWVASWGANGLTWTQSTFHGTWSSPYGMPVALAANTDGSALVQLISGGRWEYLWSSDGGASWNGGRFPHKGIASGQYNAVAYAHDPGNANPDIQKQGMFVAVGNWANVQYSIDNGKSWQYAKGLEDESSWININRVIYNSKFHRWVAIANRGRAYFSDNGTDWQVAQITASGWESIDLIAMGEDGKLVAMQQYDADADWAEGYCSHYSMDGGKSWIQTGSEGAFCQSPNSLVWHAATKKFYVATKAPHLVPEDGNGCKVQSPNWFTDNIMICSSSDGVTWKKITGLPPGT